MTLSYIQCKEQGTDLWKTEFSFEHTELELLEGFLKEEVEHKIKEKIRQKSKLNVRELWYLSLRKNLAHPYIQNLSDPHIFGKLFIDLFSFLNV